MAGCESWVRRLPLQPDQVAILSSHVNNVCGLEPGAAVDRSHVLAMRTMLAMLSPTLRTNWRIWRNVRFGGGDWGGWSGRYATATSEGIPMPLAKPVTAKKPGFRFPRDGVAIGGYVAERYPSGRYNRGVLVLTPFLDMELSAIDPSMLRPQRRIVYREDALEPLLLAKDEPQSYGFAVLYRSLPVWQHQHAKGI